MFELKHYQEQALERLREYFRRTQELRKHHDRSEVVGADVAFYEMTGRPYCKVPGLPELPYVCLRVPTGGGKTVMACRAVGAATHDLMEADRSVVLWLVPTKQIKEQTLKALADRRHPYREALEQGLGGGPIAVMEMGEALAAPRSVFDGSTCIIVSTLAASRVQDEENRKVYDSNGALMSHFQGLAPDVEARLEKEEGAGVCYSLANVFRLRHPVVIVDEAHNARTELSFETLTRFEPSCVIEFTATPRLQHDPTKGHFASNVIHDVSAWELKAAEMIKMPIRLETLANWRDVLTAALKQRAKLEELALEEAGATGERLRPILLVQAQPHSKEHETLHADEVERVLLEELNVPADWVRVATGDRRGIEGENLFASDCLVRVIITQKALAEGWDCSFAYVLCSVAEIQSAVSIEQILGRVMRLPNAKRKRHEDLNVAYAFVASARFEEMASRLRDGLVENGFDKWAAQAAVRPARDEVLTGLFSVEPTPSERGVKFSVPVLGIREGDQRRLLWPEDLLPGTWRLADCDATVAAADFELPEEGSTADIDIEEGGLKTGYVRKVALDQQALFRHERVLTREQLAYRLDRQIAHPDIVSEDCVTWLLKAVDYLTEMRGIGPEKLTRHFYYLAGRLGDKIEGYRRGAKVQPVDVRLLDGGELEVTPELPFTFPPDDYPTGGGGAAPGTFHKHYYPQVAPFDTEDERKCANILDRLELVECWVRNIAKQPRHSFWLPWRGGKFYPDFMAKLTDGRYAAVEFKGGMLAQLDDTKEKKAAGEVWEETSKGKCRFVQVDGETVFELERLLAGR